MASVAIKAYSNYNTAGNNYSKPLLGIETPILVGIGGLIVGIVVMFASWPFVPEFFHRRWFETADPEALPADATHRTAAPLRYGCSGTGSCRTSRLAQAILSGSPQTHGVGAMLLGISINLEELASGFTLGLFHQALSLRRSRRARTANCDQG